MDSPRVQDPSSHNENDCECISTAGNTQCLQCNFYVANIHVFITKPDNDLDEGPYQNTSRFLTFGMKMKSLRFANFPPAPEPSGI